MQCSDSKSRMHMAMSTPFRFCMPVVVNVQVDMALAVVLVLVRVDVVFQGSTQRPQTDAEKHHPHKSFTPVRNQFDGNQISKPE